MIDCTCPVCCAAFARYPSQMRRGRPNYCSVGCREAAWAEQSDDLAGFDPGPPVGPNDAWIDAWRAARVAAEGVSC